jgi:tetratricopeptide (TPR) repeat protein
MKSLRSALVALAVTAAALPAAAQKVAKPTPAAPPPAQVNGITDAVLDNLATQSDRYWHDGDYNRVIDLLRILIEADANDTESYANAAYLLWSQGEGPAANWLLEYGVKRSPRQGVLYGEMGYQLVRMKKDKDALPYLEKAVALANVGPTTYANLAHCYTRLGRHAESVATWKKLVARYPEFPSGAVNLQKAEKLLADSKR